MNAHHCSGVKVGAVTGGAGAGGATTGGGTGTWALHSSSVPLAYPFDARTSATRNDPASAAVTTCVGT